MSELSQLVLAVMTQVESINEALLMMNDEMTDRSLVINKASDINFLAVFESPIMREVITNYWSSIYDRKWLFQDSSSYKTIKGILFDGSKLNIEKQYRWGKTEVTGQS